MNSKDIKDIKDVKNVIGDMETKFDGVIDNIKVIKKCLMGDEENWEDGGLIGVVKNNKRWKGNVQKSLVAIGGISLTTFIKVAWNFFTGK